jgi:sec-independent protein translocase protein TatB
MIEISFGKLILLALIALIVLGPEKLPGAARMAGALLRRVRTGWDSVRAEVERELQVEEIRRQAREAADRATAAQAELDATLRKMQPIGNAVVSPAPATSEAPPESAAPALDAAPPKEAPHGGV